MGNYSSLAISYTINFSVRLQSLDCSNDDIFQTAAKIHGKIELLALVHCTVYIRSQPGEFSRGSFRLQATLQIFLSTSSVIGCRLEDISVLFGLPSSISSSRRSLTLSAFNFVTNKRKIVIIYILSKQKQSFMKGICEIVNILTNFANVRQN